LADYTQYFSENDNDNKMTMTTKRICKSLNINTLRIIDKANVVISLAKRHLFWVQTVIISPSFHASTSQFRAQNSVQISDKLCRFSADFAWFWPRSRKSVRNFVYYHIFIALISGQQLFFSIFSRKSVNQVRNSSQLLRGRKSTMSVRESKC